MRKGILHFLPAEEGVLERMTPEDLACPLLAMYRQFYEPFQIHEGLDVPHDYPGRRTVILALAEAASILVTERLIVQSLERQPGFKNPQYMVSSVGRELDLSSGLSSYRQSKLLPRELLHPSIEVFCLPSFLRGEYEMAVFRAMKEVEVAVRREACMSDNAVGVNLMRQAFAKGGLRSARRVVDAERQALSDLFAGAIGFFRNSTGHRHVDFEPKQAAHAIIFASQLLYLLESQEEGAATSEVESIT